VLFLFVLAIGVNAPFLSFSQESSGQPELHPTTLILKPSSPVEQGRLVTITVKLENTGQIAASAFKTEFFIRQRPQPGESAPSWTSFATVERTGLSPEEQEVEVKAVLDTSNPDWIPAPGVFELRVVVDSNDQIPELDETNNELIASLRVDPSRLGKPDLRPTKLTFEPPSPVSLLESVLVTTAIANTGDQDAGPFDVSFAYCRLTGRRTSCPTSFIEFQRLVFDGGLPKAAQRQLAATFAVPDLGLEPGNYLIQVSVDPPDPDQPVGLIEEQDEANNSLTASLFVQGPELFPTSLGFSPDLPRLGDTLKVTVSVKNSGEGTARNVPVAFFIDGAQFALEHVSIEQEQEIAAEGLLKTGDFNLGVGVHVVRVLVDFGDEIPERDETNNEMRTSITLHPPVPRLAELHPKRLVINPSSPVEIDVDRGLTVLTEIVNTGEVEARDFEIAFFFRAVGRVRWIAIPCATNCVVSSLATDAGVTAQGRLSLGDLAPGNYEVKIVVDPPAPDRAEGHVPELDETNNEMRSSFTLLASRRPDLFLDPLSVRIEPSLTVQRGTTARIAAEVINIGERASGPFTIEFALRRIEKEAFVVFARSERSGLQVGQGTLVDARLDTSELQPGLYELLITVDPDNRVEEGDEGNNAFSTGANPQVAQPFFVRGPDLTVIGLSFTDPTLSLISPFVTRGEAVELRADITNVGVEAAGAFDVEFCWRPVGEMGCNAFGERVRFPGLGVGIGVQARAELSTSALPPGSFEIRVTVDPVQQGLPVGEVEEENELNNAALLSLGVLPQPDLVAARVVLDPASPVEPGALITVFVDIENEGEGPTRRPFTVEFALRGLGERECEPFATAQISELPPGKQAAAKAQLRTAALGRGGFEICVTIDPENVIPEQDEENNRGIARLVIGQPDLTVRTITLDPPSPLVFGEIQEVKVFADVRNQGEGPVIEPFSVVFELRRLSPLPEEEFRVFAEVTLPGLEAGEQAAAKVELDVTQLVPGSYELCATVDPANQLPEIEEGNNRLCMTLKILAEGAVGKADLTPRRLTLEPEEANVGDSVKVTAEIANIGGEDAGPFRVVFLYRRLGSDRLVNFAQFPFSNGLPAGQTAVVTKGLDTWITWKGQFEIIVRVDVNDTVDEANELNNEISARLVVR
jgi:subtilase family serine protease